MKRREYLRGAGLVGAGALAGCTTGEEDTPDGGGDGPNGDGGDGSSDGTPTSSPTGTSDGASASFELVSVDGPEIVEIGETAEWSFTVENTGDLAGPFETRLSTVDGSAWYSFEETVSATVAAGDQARLSGEPFSLAYMATVDVAIEAFDDAFYEVSFVGTTREYGQQYAAPNGIEVVVDGVRFASEYEWGTGNVERPTTGTKWAFLSVSVTNVSGEAARLPAPSTFGIVTKDDEEHDVESFFKDEKYAGGEVADGETRSGEILFEVPLGTTAENARATWSREFLEGPVRAFWTAPE